MTHSRIHAIFLSVGLCACLSLAISQLLNHVSKPLRSVPCNCTLSYCSECNNASCEIRFCTVCFW